MSKPPYDTPAVKTVTPYKGDSDSDTSETGVQVSQGSDTSMNLEREEKSFTVILRPVPSWRTSGVMRLRPLLKIALISLGLRCMSCCLSPPKHNHEEKEHIKI